MVLCDPKSVELAEHFLLFSARAHSETRFDPREKERLVHALAVEIQMAVDGWFSGRVEDNDRETGTVARLAGRSDKAT